MKSNLFAICFISFLSILSCGMKGQTAGEVPSTSPDTPTVLPLAYLNGHLFVTLADDKLGSLSMLVDTGTDRTAIAVSIAKREKLQKSFWKRTLTMIRYGSDLDREEWRTVPVTLRAGKVSVFTGSAQVIDLGKKPVDGILGWDFFEHWCTTLDFAQKRLTLRRLSQCSPPAGAIATLDGKWPGHGLGLRTTILFRNGQSVNASFIVDTGSDTTLLLNTRFRGPAGFPTEEPKAAATDSGAKGTLTADLVPVTRIDFEDGKLNAGDGIKMVIARKDYFPPWHWWYAADGALRMVYEGGIGNGILEHFRWTFDPAAKKIYVEAN